METKKKFSMLDLILTVICVIFVAEAAAPVAAIGNSQFFWWILLIFTFLLPYGLMAAELGTTYESEGGMIDWATRALGKRWGARTAWYYWVNFPIWMTSLAVMGPELIGYMFGIELGIVPTVIIELVFIWGITLISTSPASENIWILNIGGVVKLTLALALGIFGLYTGFTKGFANPITFSSLFPHSLGDISYISVVLFNFLGFEVVCTFADSMENPKKQIPQAIIVGGVIIAAIYIFSSFGIGVGIPVDEISTSSGIVDAFQVMTGSTTGIIISIVAALFFITLIGNMISWAMGVNNAVAYAADNGGMPAVFKKRNPKNNVPVGAAFVNGIVATILIFLSHVIPNQDVFWAFFSLNLFAFLVSYLPMFPAFLKLRKMDKDIQRGYTVPGSDGMLKLIAYLPFAEIIICLIFVVVPMSFDAETLAATLPVTIGAVLIVLIDEIYLRITKIQN